MFSYVFLNMQHKWGAVIASLANVQKNHFMCLEGMQLLKSQAKGKE